MPDPVTRWPPTREPLRRVGAPQRRETFDAQSVSDPSRFLVKGTHSEGRTPVHLWAASLLSWAGSGRQAPMMPIPHTQSVAQGMKRAEHEIELPCGFYSQPDTPTGERRQPVALGRTATTVSVVVHRQDMPMFAYTKTGLGERR